MAKKTADDVTAAMAEKIWVKVRELQEARKKVFEAHETHRTKMLPYMTELARETSEGCAGAAEIAGQIEQLIATGKLLGLIEATINYMDYL